MAISSIRSSQYGYQPNTLQNQALARNRQQLASGKRINSAADDAAGLAVSKKLETLIKGYKKATDNADTMRNAVNVADSALGGATESLQRVRELGIQAANGIYTDEDRAAMQLEANQYLDKGTGHLDQISATANFNGQTLLDGTFTSKTAAVNPDGSGTDVSIDSMSVTSLGLEGLQYSSEMNAVSQSVDQALGRISSARADLGAKSNALESTASYNRTSVENLESGRSRIEDEDIAEGIMQLTIKNALKQYSMAMQKNQMQSAGTMLSLLV